MKRQLKKMFIIPMLLTVFSCDESPKRSDTATDNTPKKISTLEATDLDVADLTRVGEILINNPFGVLYTDKIFNSILEIQPKNSKALFYSAFTGILMTMEGSMYRSKSMYDNPADLDDSITYLETELKYPELVDFIIGKKDATKFTTYQDLKSFFQHNIINAFDAAIEKLGKIEGNVDVVLTQLKTKNTEIIYDCTGDDTYQECSLKEDMDGIELLPAQTVSIDKNDLQIISNGLKAYNTFFKLISAYSIEGQKHLTNEIKVKELELKRALTEKERNVIVDRYTSYLTLEKDHRIDEVVKDLEDIAQVAMDIDSLNNKFCNNDSREENLIKSICFDDEMRASVKETLAYLSGPREITLGKDVDLQDVKIIIDLPTFLNNPLNDLKSLRPDSYDDQGVGKYTTEPKLNGLFPNSDLLEKLKKVNEQ